MGMNNMKKIVSFAVIGIILCVLTVSQAYAGYKIFWWGDRSHAGSIPTSETSRTEQASIELFNQLFPDLTPYPSGTGLGFICVFNAIYWVPQNCVGGLSSSGDCFWKTGEVYESGIWEAGESLGGGSTSITEAGSWDVFLDDVLDSDGDFVPDASDNCPDTANTLQRDVDNDGIGDVCDNNTINGNISGDVQEGINVNIYVLSCGVPQPYATVTTDAQGYYAIGDIPNGRYLVGPVDNSYRFAPEGFWGDIPQAESQSYDFTATADRFIENGNGTVTDSFTDLIWLKDANCIGSQAWDESILLVAGLKSGACGLTDGSGEGDWRLPYKSELQGLGTDPPETWDHGIHLFTWNIVGQPFSNLQPWFYRAVDGYYVILSSEVYTGGYTSTAGQIDSNNVGSPDVLPVRDNN
jgi:hypothetical protein